MTRRHDTHDPPRCVRCGRPLRPGQRVRIADLDEEPPGHILSMVHVDFRRADVKTAKPTRAW
jgi:hypothetical protein